MAQLEDDFRRKADDIRREYENRIDDLIRKCEREKEDMLEKLKECGPKRVTGGRDDGDLYEKKLKETLETLKVS